MIAIPCRARIAGVALAAILLSSRGANADGDEHAFQTAGSTNPVITGAAYDIVNQQKAERRLGFLQGKLRRDEERGNASAVERDVRKIQNTSQRIAVDEWLIRKNLLQEPGCYPYPPRLDSITCAAIGQYRRPPHVHYGR
ncbi:hypothetical protein TA3x_004867 [Tundrisphaera sp. TA3]|uniref:hypothetical protein n=1 Tax=Tundrisphaera sp. TA3 TaxID=3435775 RepID=UPI003EBD1400